MASHYSASTSSFTEANDVIQVPLAVNIAAQN
jgi:hypothetical protein